MNTDIKDGRKNEIIDLAKQIVMEAGLLWPGRDVVPDWDENLETIIGICFEYSVVDGNKISVPLLPPKAGIDPEDMDDEIDVGQVQPSSGEADQYEGATHNRTHHVKVLEQIPSF